MFNLSLILWLILLSLMIFRDRKQENNLGKHFGYTKCLYVKYLRCIPEIIGEIGVFPVTFPGVPTPEPISLFTFGSFGADQCSSSVGFLVTYTPRDWRIVICCGYSLFSEDLSNVSHNGRQSIQGRCRSIATPEKEVERPRIRQEWQYCRSGGTEDDPSEIGIHLNLMMTSPEPEGFLVAIEPTDDGRIGTVRKPDGITNADLAPS